MMERFDSYISLFSYGFELEISDQKNFMHYRFQEFESKNNTKQGIQ
jgi:hypothetical protein